MSLAAALALPADVPGAEPDPAGDVRRDPGHARGPGPHAPARDPLGPLGRDGGRRRRARARTRRVYEAGLAAIRVQRPRWPGHQPLLDRMEEGIRDRQQHLPTEDAEETEERRIEQLEHREIRLAVVGKQRRAVNALRDEGVINDATLRTLERELDLDELQTEA